MTPLLLQTLDSPDINIARTAAAFLGKTDDQAAIDLLTERLEKIDSQFLAQKVFGGSDRTGEVWTVHVEALAYVAPQNAIEFLRSKLSVGGSFNTVLTMFTDASDLLMKLDSEAMLPELIGQLKSTQDNHQKKQILNLLEDTKEYSSIVSNLVEILLREEDESIQVRIIKILKKSNTELVNRTLIELISQSRPELRQEACNQLIERKTNQTHELEKLLAHEDWNIAWTAAVVLGSLGHEIALPLLADAMKHHKQVGIRITSAKALGKISRLVSTSSLLKALHDDSLFVRREAAFSLSEFDRREAIPELMLSLTAGYLNARTNGIKGLARLKVEEPLWNILHEKPAVGWQAAAVELVKLDKFEALPDLCIALADLGGESSDEVIHLLSEFADRKTLNWLLNALENPEQYTLDPYFCNRIAFVLIGCHLDILEEKLPHLVNLQKERYIQQLSWIILTTQGRCKFYNYEIAQSVVKEESGVSGVGCREGVTYNIESVSILNTGNVTTENQVGEHYQLKESRRHEEKREPSTPVVKKILILASSPVNAARLRLDKEVREIDEALRRSQKRDQFKLEQRWAIRTDDLRRALIDIQPQIVHFCGHGTGTAGLLLEDESGQAVPVSTEALANLFGLCADHIECVVLNACYSDVQANAIVQQIPYVIGMQDAVGDAAAIKFATGFYDGLGGRGTDGNGYEAAHKFGCNAIHLENLPGHLTPKLLKKI